MKTSVGECLNSESLKDLRKEMPERRRFITKEKKNKKRKKENGSKASAFDRNQKKQWRGEMSQTKQSLTRTVEG